jgi:hypothetical protein
LFKPRLQIAQRTLVFDYLGASLRC